MLVLHLSTIIIGLGFTSALVPPPSNFTPGVFYADGVELPMVYTHDVPPTLRKRANTPIVCDPGEAGWNYRLTESHCDRQTSPQNWECNGIMNQNLYNVKRYQTLGACADSQVCVDGLNGGQLTYCADQDGFIQISQTLLTKMAQQGFQYVYGGPTGDTSAVEAVFTDPDDATKPITLDSLDIIAGKSQALYGQYTTQSAGETECSDCSSLGFQPIPLQSSFFQIKGTFPASVTGARMYFWQSSGY